MEAQPDQGFWSPNGRADPPSPSSTEKSSPRNASQSGQAQALAWEGSPGAEREWAQLLVLLGWSELSPNNPHRTRFLPVARLWRRICD